MRILRTKCEFDWTTPFGSVRTLPINCATSDSYTWPWQYFFTRTRNSYVPTSSSGTERSAASMYLEESSDSGQSVIRGFFAYIATNPFYVSVELSASTSQPWFFDIPFQARENILLVARLYSAKTELLETFINSVSPSESQSFQLPATVCPKVLWLSASVQPTGDAPDNDPPVYLPSTEAKINFSA